MRAVAGLVPVFVVQLLQLVDVDHQHRVAALRAARAQFVLAVQDRLEGPQVQQARQAVALRHLLDAPARGHDRARERLRQVGDERIGADFAEQPRRQFRRRRQHALADDHREPGERDADTMTSAPRRPSVIATSTIGSRYRLTIGLAEPPVWIATTVMKATMAAAPSAMRAPVSRTGNPRQRNASTKSV